MNVRVLPQFLVAETGRGGFSLPVKGRLKSPLPPITEELRVRGDMGKLILEEGGLSVVGLRLCNEEDLITTITETNSKKAGPKDERLQGTIIPLKPSHRDAPESLFQTSSPPGYLTEVSLTLCLTCQFHYLFRFHYRDTFKLYKVTPR